MEAFRDQVWHERRTRAFGLLLLVVVFGALAWALYLRNAGPRVLVTGIVVRFGTHPDGFGDHPLVLVRIPDGSLHRMDLPPDQISQCQLGDRIALVTVGKTYEVGVQGCNVAQDPKP